MGKFYTVVKVASNAEVVMMLGNVNIDNFTSFFTDYRLF